MRNISVTLNLTEEQVQELLNSANLGREGALQLRTLSNEQFEKLKQQIQDTADNFAEEIVDGSFEACANDWLCDFRGDDEE
jgi:hypothetical protein